ncbi:response regulator [Tumidithrix elongata RA019]|uniref:Circadian input-output histidine kinase CikA n=1 Tax=Tumidithrix elongata BACA0141 TaxID=2716417 RepID=A0AAW9PR51_9CYAN|nr:response regulator [Tumidithrix elongata RA019]
MSEPLHVLIVEDAEDDALLTLRELRRGGFNVVYERVETAEALRVALVSQPWDAVLSDYNLPGFNAPMALQIVKQSQPNLPFIVISGTIGEASAVELMKSGAHDYLMKGNLTRLPEMVRREVREAQMRLERRQAAIELEQTQERLQLAIEGSGIGLWDWSVQTGAMTINQRWAEMLGYTLEELEPIGIDTWQHNAHPEDLQKLSIDLESHFRQETKIYERELRMRHKSDAWFWILCKGKVVDWDAEGKPLRMIGTHLDINDRKQAELRLALQNSILERIAKAEPLPDILDALALATEDQTEGGLCSILFCDREGKLHYGAAPHLPEEYNQNIEGIAIGEGIGPCVTAAFRKEPVIIPDIATAQLSQDYKDLALAHGLRACWSVPVFASDGSVLATFAVQYRELHHPQERELKAIALVTNLVKIAIEQELATQALEQLNQELEDRVAQRTAALQQSEASLREAQLIAHLGSWELDVQTRKITWTAEIFRIFGLDPNSPEPTYEALLGYFPTDDRNRFIHLIDRAIQLGEPSETDLQIIRADGSLGYIFAKAEVIWNQDAQVTRLFGITMDISDRKAIQEALKRSEERSRATLLALPDLVYRVNRKGQYIDFLVSPQGRNLVEPQQVIGKYLPEVLPYDIAESQCSLIQQALATQTVQIQEQQVQLDGKQIYEEVRVAPCGNDEVVFFIRDISDRKQAEAQLQQTNQELARATRLKDEFLANMSHELRTPLNAILGMTEGLEDGVFGSVSDRQLKAFKTIERSGNHLLELITDILDVAKIESGKIELECAPIDITPLCQSSLTFIKQQALKKNIQIESRLPPNLPELYVDERRIRQVLINLLSNAVKFTPENGRITLEVTRITSSPIEKESGSALRLAKEKRAFLQIAVIDTGIGISPENIKKLFQPFIQIDSALNRKYDGTGLGLALVKRLVELHGGEVGLTSEVGVGSCFTIALPCVASATSSLKPEAQTELRTESSQLEPKASPLILLVDDNEANVITVSGYLEAKGYRIISAKNGKESIALAQSEDPDLILMDIQMPEMDGLEAIQQIRQVPNLANKPIVALTALAMAGDRERCIEAGATEYLAKPIRMKELSQTIQTLLAQ